MKEAAQNDRLKIRQELTASWGKLSLLKTACMIERPENMSAWLRAKRLKISRQLCRQLRYSKAEG